MTIIKREGFDIICDGHAGDKICCAMLTALTVALINNLIRLEENPDYELYDGYFRLDTHDISIEGDILVEAYMYALQGLAESYPEHFKYID